MRKLLTTFFVCCFFTISHAEVNEKILGKAEGYPNNCDYPKSDYTKCLVAILTANDRATTKMVRRQVLNTNKESFRELTLDTSVLNERIKNKLDDDFKRLPSMAMLIVKNGKLIYENYQYDRKSSDKFLYFSMTKNIVGLTVGKAIELGYIESIDDPASKYIPELSASPYYQVTIKNLLQMTAGIGYVFDPYSPNSDSTNLTLVTNGWSEKHKNLTDYLNQYKPSRKNDEQGKYFNYDDNATNVLVMVVKNATKKPFTEFFSENIWSKIGAESDASWQGNNQNDLMGHMGFHSTPKDLVRLGLVLMNEGKYLNNQIISTNWINKQFSPLVKADKNKGGEYYGYQTWVLDSSGSKFAFKGHLGQSMMINKKTNTMLVTFGVDIKNEYWGNLHDLFEYVSERVEVK